MFLKSDLAPLFQFSSILKQAGAVLGVFKYTRNQTDFELSKIWSVSMRCHKVSVAQIQKFEIKL